MSRVKAKDTVPELTVRRSLRENGFSGYRLHYKKVPGRPDIVFVGKKIAIFVNGCFWHRCPKCSQNLPKHNSVFWKEKFDANKVRDAKKVLMLKAEGWKVFVLWECEVKTKIDKLIQPIIKRLKYE